MTTCAVGRKGECLLPSEEDLLYQTLAELKKTPIEDIKKELVCKDNKCVVDSVYNLLSSSAKHESLRMQVKIIRELAFKPDGPVLNKMLDNFILFRLGRQICANCGVASQLRGNEKVSTGGALQLPTTAPVVGTAQSGEEPQTSKYLFGGCIMMDFADVDTIWSDPENVLKSYQEDKWEQLHIIINTDASAGNGIHWQHICIDPKNGSAEFFCSYGTNPPQGPTMSSTGKQFNAKLGEWFTDIIKLFNDAKVPMCYKQNMRCHQEDSDNVNCGVYCLVEMYRRCKGESLEKINSKHITKKIIDASRAYFFEPTSSYYTNMSSPEKLPWEEDIPL